MKLHIMKTHYENFWNGSKIKERSASSTKYLLIKIDPYLNSLINDRNDSSIWMEV